MLQGSSDVELRALRDAAHDRHKRSPKHEQDKMFMFSGEGVHAAVDPAASDPTAAWAAKVGVEEDTDDEEEEDAEDKEAEAEVLSEGWAEVAGTQEVHEEPVAGEETFEEDVEGGGLIWAAEDAGGTGWASLPARGVGTAVCFNNVASQLMKIGTYRGGFVDGMPHGHGVFTKEGSTWAGPWRDGHMRGYGELRLRDEKVEYRGEMLTCEGGFMRHGWGIWRPGDDATMEGRWEEDQLAESRVLGEDFAIAVKAAVEGAHERAASAANGARTDAHPEPPIPPSAAASECWVAKNNRLRINLPKDSVHLEEVRGLATGWG